MQLPPPLLTRSGLWFWITIVAVFSRVTLLNLDYDENPPCPVLASADTVLQFATQTRHATRTNPVGHVPGEMSETVLCDRTHVRPEQSATVLGWGWGGYYDNYTITMITRRYRNQRTWRPVDSVPSRRPDVRRYGGRLAAAPPVSSRPKRLRYECV